MLIEAFGKNKVLLKMIVYWCYNKFLNGKEKVEDEAHMGWLPTVRNETMINMARCIVCKEHRITVCELAT